jgi:hypothetical protein
MRYKVWRSRKHSSSLHLLCAEGSEAFGPAGRDQKTRPWTGGPEVQSIGYACHIVFAVLFAHGAT